MFSWLCKFGWHSWRWHSKGGAAIAPEDLVEYLCKRSSCQAHKSVRIHDTPKGKVKVTTVKEFT